MRATVFRCAATLCMRLNATAIESCQHRLAGKGPTFASDMSCRADFSFPKECANRLLEVLSGYVT